MPPSVVSTRNALLWGAVAVLVLVWVLRDLVLLVGYSVVLGLVTVAGWLLALAVPRLGAQAARFASGAPEALARLVQGLRAYGASHGLSSWLDPAVEGARANVSGLLQNLVGTLAGWAGKGLGGLGQLLG